MSSRSNLSVREVPQAAGPLAPFLQDIRRALAVLGSQAALVPELESAGILQTSNSGAILPPDPLEERTTPPQPTAVEWDAAVTNVIVKFAGFNYRGHSYAEILRAETSDYSAAQVVARGFNGVAVDALGPGRQAYYWVRFVSSSGTAGPPDTQAGTLLKTGADVRALLDVLTDAAQDGLAPYSKHAVRAGLFYVTDPASGVDAPLFAVVTQPITMNGVQVQPGVYMASSFIMDGTITNAKIANAAIDSLKVANAAIGTAHIQDLAVSNAKIADLNAAKIIAGTITTDKLTVNAATAASSSLIGTGQIALGPGSWAQIALPSSPPLKLVTTGAPVKVLATMDLKAFKSVGVPWSAKFVAQLYVDGALAYEHETIGQFEVMAGGSANGSRAAVTIPLVYRTAGLVAGEHSFYVLMSCYPRESDGSATSWTGGSSMTALVSIMAEENKV